MYYFRGMKFWKCFLLGIVLMIPGIVLAETWFPTPIDSEVTVSFPDVPKMTDTLGQQIYSVQINNDMMLSIKARVPVEKWPKDSISEEILLDMYIRETLEGTTLLLQSPAILQNTETIFYKFKVDEGTNKGLVAENYVFYQGGKIYHFAYWRFQPMELPNQMRMKRFFESVEIKAPTTEIIDNVKDASAPPDTFEQNKNSNLQYLLIAVVAVLSAIVIYFLIEKYKQKTT
jgi:hypothetical protein